MLCRIMKGPGHMSTPVTAIPVIEHGKYIIKSGKLAGEWVARAFPKPPAKSKGLVAEAKGSSAEDAVETLKVQLEQDQTQRETSRRVDKRSGLAIPLRQEFITALEQTKLSDAQVAMLKAHSIAGTHGLTGNDLARAGGYSNFDTANVIYGKAGRALGEYLGVDTGDPKAKHGEIPAALLAGEGVPRPETGQSVWVMHRELREAVRLVL